MPSIRCSTCNHFVPYELATRDARINKINYCAHPGNWSAKETGRNASCLRWEPKQEDK